jgi:DHA2 family multidrug resistance protein
VPLSTATFATLSPAMRAPGTALFSLMRNIGSSIGISIVQSVVTRNSQIVHASLVEHVSQGDSGWQQYFDLTTAAGRESVNHLIDQQSSMIAYVDAFKLMFIASLCIVPLIAIIRLRGGSANDDAAAHAVMD